jgi:hypothetical protein
MDKKFVKKTIAWFFVVVVFMFIINIIVQQGMMDDFFLGFPLKITDGGGMCKDGSCGSHFYLLNLIIDIIIWLAIAAGLAKIVHKKKV